MTVGGPYYRFYCGDAKRSHVEEDGDGRLLRPDACGACTVAPHTARSIPRWYECLAKEIVKKGTPIRKVTKLNLGGCLMGDQGMEWVGGSLVVFAESKGLDSLAVLDLSSNRLTDKSVPNLLTLAKRLKGLQRLRLSQNYFSRGVLEGLTGALGEHGSIRSVYFGADCAHHPGVAVLERQLQLQGACAPSPVRDALMAELEGTYNEHKRCTRLQLEATERSEVEAKETKKRSDIANGEHEARCEVLHRYSMGLQRHARGKDTRFIFEANVTKLRAAIASERENKMLKMYIEFRRQRQQVEEYLRAKDKVLQLSAYAPQFFDRFMESEVDARQVIENKFVREIGTVMSREQSALSTVEIDARCTICKEQDDARKALLASNRHLLKVKGASRSRRTDMTYLERVGRNTVISNELTSRNTLMNDEKAHKQQAREATYAADQAAVAGPLRVLVREEAHCRLEISDIEEAGFRNCSIGCLLDLPNMAPEQQAAAKKLKEQQHEEYRAKMRERSVAKMDDLRSTRYNTFSFNPALSVSFARSFSKAPPSLGVRGGPV